MYRFTARPRWLLSHLLVVALVALMVNLGFWQLRRLDQKRDFNSLVRARQQVAPAELSTMLEPTASFETADAVTYRRAEATGEYDRGNEILVRSRTQDGQPGAWVLTPLLIGDGSAVVVNRGFFPDPGVPESMPPAAAAPEGELSVAGLLMPTQTRGSFGPQDPAAGRLNALSRVDLARLQEQVPYDLYPVWLQAATTEPTPAAELPVPVPAPELDEGPHLSYAIQWFLFSLIAVIGYPLILRRVAHDRAQPDVPGSGSDEPTPVVASASAV